MHHPLVFSTSVFIGREENQSTYEREKFRVVQAFRKPDRLLSCDFSTLAFTDHRNLLFIFNLVAMELFPGGQNVLKIVRWALYLSALIYRIEHVRESSNS